MLDDAAIAGVLRGHAAPAATGAARIAAANEAGGKDNIAVVLARVVQAASPAGSGSRPWWPFGR